LWQFQITNNPNLTCVFVDDAAWSTTNWTNVDVTTTFVETQAECDAIAAINDISNEELLYVSPNPTTGILNILNTSKSIIEKVVVTNVLGKQVIQTRVNNNQIDISNLSNGVYFVNLIAKNGDKTSYKIVKN